MLPGPKETKAAGALLGSALKMESVSAFLITLEGPLGVGKTTLCQGLAEAMGAEPKEIVSPTFTLCNVYQTEKPLFHLDLYRLNQETAAEEFVGSGLEECLDGFCLVEWPERLNNEFWPTERLELIFDINGKNRILSACGQSPVATRIWQATVKTVGKELCPG
ncbi:MAG: tRNA (adenosine(37)-N6)-threonylcarbamoyltransferase complex ATPase subunit type 1 TsaE [Deltaproteobacteria bacterium]|nr:tRNA (adenosine(37)-N6)-threonylcarbamoyltransferase complex ATPase subunit type 1 TsaE [Deltaproteobacteria bacterium]